MKKLLLMFSLIFMVTSCDDNMSYMEEMTDFNIEAIANDPNKFEVDGVIFLKLHSLWLQQNTMII